MATFHPFPHLPLEVRILIWQHATETRLLIIYKRHRPMKHYWSPTPAPAVTRACAESRKYTSYQKTLTMAPSPHYIWANFASDVVYVPSVFLDCFQHLRFDVARFDKITTRTWHSYSMSLFAMCPRLQSVEILVKQAQLTSWTEFVKTTSLGACPRENVRIVIEALDE
jgi:hypothetical protein